MLDALCEHLLEKPGLYLDETAVFLWDEFQIQVTKSSISRALAFRGWSKKTTQQRAREFNADLQDVYFHNISEFYSEHLVFVCEPGCDRQIDFRQMAWSPLVVVLLRSPNSIATNSIKYCLLMPKMGLSSPVYFRVQLTLLSLAISSSSFFNLRRSYNCVLMLMLRFVCLFATVLIRFESI